MTNLVQVKRYYYTILYEINLFIITENEKLVITTKTGSKKKKLKKGVR